MKRLWASVRCWFVVVGVALALKASAATVRTANFVVTADSQALAQQVADCAEKARREEARAWLGHELETWAQPCPIKVTVTTSLGGGATSFGFGGRGVPGMSCNVEGRADKILSSVVPHEVNHMVFASYLQSPVPRWCDEGAAVTWEDPEELARQDKLCREILNTAGRKIPLARLLALKDYPSDVMALYAEGYCVTQYLIGLKGRPQFLMFVWHGMQRTWPEALRASYGIEDENDLEKRWLAYMKETKGQTPRATVGGASGATQGASPPAAAPSDGDVAKALGLLTEAQRLLAAKVQQLESNDKRQDQRLDRIEERLGWNQPRQASQPSAPTASVQPYQPGRFAAPTAAPPSASPFVQPINQPFCPPGGT